jgi:hypothetical protein
MTSRAILGMWVMLGFLLVVAGEAVVITVLAYKLGVYKGKLARYELTEKQSPAAEGQL